MLLRDEVLVGDGPQVPVAVLNEAFRQEALALPWPSPEGLRTGETRRLDELSSMGLDHQEPPPMGDPNPVGCRGHDRHLEILRKGVSTWNLWRRSCPGEVPDLRGSQLALLGLRGCDFSGARLEGANLGRSDLRNSILDGALLTGAALGGVNLSGARLDGADFTRAKMQRANFSGAFAQKASFQGAILTHSIFRGSVIEDSDFRGADLRVSWCSEAIFRRCDFTDALLHGMTTRSTDFCGVELALIRWAQPQEGRRGWGGPVCIKQRMRIDAATVVRSGWSMDTARGLVDSDCVDFKELVAVLTGSGPPRGLTLTFDTRLHRFDPTAFDAFIAQVLGPDTDVTIEERSNIDVEGPSFFRINGSRPEDLVAVAEAFYDRVWENPVPHPSEAAIMQAMSSGFAMILGRLSHQREHLVRIEENVGILCNDDVQEMLEDQGSAHVLARDKKLLQTRYQRIAEGLAKEAPKKLLATVIGESASGALGEVVGEALGAAVGAAAETAVDEAVEVLMEEDDE